MDGIIVKLVWLRPPARRQTKKPMAQVISQTYVIGRRGGNKDKKASKALIKNLTAI